MPFSWLDASQAKGFGETLAKFFMQRIPLDVPNKKTKSMAQKQEVLEKMYLQIIKFNSNKKLNIYKKAQLGNSFKWVLKEAGYDPDFVDQLTKELMVKF